MRDPRVRIEMINLLGGPTEKVGATASPDAIADWFENVIAELDQGPLLTH